MFRMKNLILLIFVSLVNSQYERSRSCYSDADILNRLVSNQSPSVPPSDAHVLVQFFVHSIKSLDSLLHQVELGLYVTEQWYDPSLRFEGLTACSEVNLTTTGDILTKIWTPRMHFVDSIEAKMLLSPNQNDFVMIYPNGTIWRNYRVDVTAPCEGSFFTYPFENQTCTLTYASLIYNAQRVNVSWMNQAVKVSNSRTILPKHELPRFEPEKIVKMYRSGQWIELKLNIHFQRIYGWHRKYIYIPSFLLVFISWISFCLGTAMAARAILGCTTFLGLLLIYLFSARDLTISYITYGDWWMIICLVFVFLSLLELALFALVSRSVCNNYNLTCHIHADNESRRPLVPDPKCRVSKRNVATVIDIVFAVLFPLFFVIFIILYYWHPWF